MKKISILDVSKPNWLRNYQPRVTPWYEQIYNEICVTISKFRGIVRDIRVGVANLVKYAPLIWKDRDWDYEFLLDLIEFKLKNMSKCIDEEKIIIEYPTVCKEMNEAVKNIYNFKNSSEVFEDMSQDILRNMLKEKDKDKLSEMEHNYYRQLYEFEEEEWKKIWDNIKENMRGWWS